MTDETSLRRAPKVSTRKGQLIEVAVNEDKQALEDPVIIDLHSYGDGDFPQDVLTAGLQKEMQALTDFDVYEEVGVNRVAPHLVNRR